MTLLLKSLEEEGFNREKVESELDYSPNYIGQQISKGGNKKIVKALERLLQKAKNERAGQPVNPKAILPIGDLRVTLKDHFDLMREHTDFVKDHASLMQRLVEARLLKSGKVSSGAGRKTPRNLPGAPGARKSRFEEKTSVDKSRVQDRRAEQDKSHVKDKSNKVQGKKG